MKTRSQMICKSVIFIFMTVCVASSYAQEQNNISPYLALLPNGTNLSILVKTVEKNPETIIAYQQNQFSQPASLQKIITALAAELELGQDFQFITRMQTNGTIKNGQLKGDLIVQMSGDPTFDRTQLREMLSELKRKGINSIIGDIIIDSSIFAGHDKAPGWPWNNLTACYNTPPSAIIIDENCFYAGILPAKKVGEKATASASSIYPIKLTSKIRTISQHSESVQDKYCELDMTSLDKNHYYLSGCIKHSRQKSYFRFAILDGFNYFSSILKSELKHKKIKFVGRIIETKDPTTISLVPLATNQSAPLSELLTIMLKNSNNLIADTLFRTIGAHYFEMSGTWKNSSDAIKAILRSKADIDLENAVIVDGSGLSRLNLIDANKLMQILQYIAANNDRLNIIDMLPVSGVDGTLKNRKSFSNNHLKSIIYAKTGYLEGHYNLAGFIKIDQNRYVAFTQFISGYSYMNSENKPKNSAIVEFEKAIYQNLLLINSE